MWHDVGLYKSGSMSIEPIGWSELAAYKAFCDVNQFEARSIISMSKSFVSSINNSKDPLTPAPYCQDPELALSQDREKVARQMMEMKALRRNRR